MSFYTSDSPIVPYNPNGPCGLALEYTQIYCPINPQLCICLLDPYHFSNFNEPHDFDKKHVRDNIIRPSVYIFTEREEIDIKMINILQAFNSTRHIFYKNDEFQWVKDMFKRGILKKPSEKTRFTRI